MVFSCNVSSPAGEIIGYYRDRQYRVIDGSTGETSPISPAPGGTAESMLSVDPTTQIAYRIEQGEHTLYATDLVTTTTRQIQITGAEAQVNAIAAFNGKLIGQFSEGNGGSLRWIDLTDGSTTIISDAPTPTMHRSLSVDPTTEVAVRLNIVGSRSQEIEVIDLNTGATHSFVPDDWALKIDFYGGRAVGHFADSGNDFNTRSFREINIQSGALTFLALAPETTQNGLFSVDPRGERRLHSVRHSRAPDC